MQLQEAVRLRILELEKEKGFTTNRLAEISGITPSALKYTIADYARVKNTGVVTIKKLCQGLGISFKEFWDSSLFDENNLDYEE